MDELLFKTLCWCAIVLFIIYFLSKFQGTWTLHAYRCTKNIPGPKGIPVIGNMFQFWDNQESLFMLSREYAKKFKTIYKIRVLNRMAINLLNPDDIESVIASMNFIEKSHLYTLLHPWLGTGLLTSGGSKWHTRRKILTPTFHFNILHQFAPIIGNHAQQIVKKLDEECRKTSTNLIPTVTNFTLRTLCETTMGLQIEENEETIITYKKSIMRYGYIMLYRLFRPWLHYSFIFNLTPIGFKSRKVVKSLHKFTTDVIKERLDTWNDSIVVNDENEFGKKRLAMLDLLITQMKSGEDITYNGIREEVDTFMFEGHDTTTIGICFTLMEIANNKFAQDLIVEELDHIFENSNRLPTYQDLQNMNYLERCIKESLRLNPPVPFISRYATDDIKLKNYTLPKGCFVHIQIYDLHRNPLYWSEPDKFDPDRFLQENCVERHPFLYIPFSAGPRNCIGQKFALMELKIFISTLLREYILEPIDTRNSIKYVADLVLRTKIGVHVKLRKRTRTTI